MNEKIGHRLQQARRDAGYRFAVDAAERLRLHVQNVRDHEAGRRTIQPGQLVKYAKHYKVSIDWLMTGKTTSGGSGSKDLAFMHQLSPEDLDEVIQFARFKLSK